MQFVVHAYDYSDEGALERRMAVRESHFVGARKLKANGNFVLGGALLSPEGKMIGSLMIVEFDDEAGLQEWLSWEPYANNRVWERIDVKPFRLAEV